MEKFSVIDLFAGAGGFGLGFKLDGYKIKISLEVDEWAVDTLNANNRDHECAILRDDIRIYDNLTPIQKGLKKGVDVIIGGPPCQGFSHAGGTKDPNDPRNTLFVEFARWVGFLKPKVFVMENVSGLLHRKNSKGEKVIEIIKKTFQDLNYAVEIWNLDAAEYGVPQHRNRIFIVGNKFGKTIGKPPITHVIPGKDYGKLNTEKLKSALTVIEAISDLPIIKAGEGQDIMLYTSKPKNQYQKMLRNESAFVFNHEAMKHTKRMVERYREIQSGVVFDSLPDTLKVKKRNGNGILSDVVYQSNYRHLKPDMISYTIPASFYSNFIHPSIPRNITSREAARLQSFPDWYVFRGKRTQISSKLLSILGKGEEDNLSQYNQIGNAVPPLLAKAIAKRLKSFLKRNR